MAKKAYVGVDNKARKVRKIYVGVDTEFPIYENQNVSTNVSVTNISEFFDVSNGTYYFVGEDTVFTSNSSSTTQEATTTLIAKQDMDLSFTYSYPGSGSSSSLARKTFNLTIAGNAIESNAYSTSTEYTVKTWSGHLNQGESIEIRFKRGTTTTSGTSNTASFYDMVSTCEKSVVVDHETKSVAKHIVKGYVGVNGVARLFWYKDIVNLGVGAVDSLSIAGSANEKATTVGDYGLFAIYTEKTAINTTYVEAYGKNLQKQTIAPFTEATNRGAFTTVGNYAVYAGGVSNSATNAVYRTKIVAYTPTSFSMADETAAPLGQSRRRLSAASSSNYAIFAGGTYSNAGSDSYMSKYVDAYDTSLTKYQDSIESLSLARYEATGASTGNHVVFIGGLSGSNSLTSSYSTVIDAYDGFSLSKNGNVAQLPSGSGRHGLAAANMGSSILFGGGLNNYSTRCSEVWRLDSSLTLLELLEMPLSSARTNLVATHLDNYILFAGGTTGVTDSNVVDIYDKSLTRTNPSDKVLTEARQLWAATTVGDYALFGGGLKQQNGNERSTVVDVYSI